MSKNNRIKLAVIAAACLAAMTFGACSTETGNSEPVTAVTSTKTTAASIEAVSYADGEEYVIDEFIVRYNSDEFEIIGVKSREESSYFVPEELDGIPVTAIGYNAFQECRKAETINIPDTIRLIGDRAFFRCESISTFHIPAGVTSIGKQAFAECTMLTDIELPNNITVISDTAFYMCKSLTAFVIPDSVTRIDDAAFSQCTGLKSISIPDSVTSIGLGAFCDCIDLVVTAPHEPSFYGYNVDELVEWIVK